MIIIRCASINCDLYLISFYGNDFLFCLVSVVLFPPCAIILKKN